MSAALSLPSLDLDRSPSRVVVECEWCSLDARRYVRFGGRGTETSEDVLDLCDDCAVVADKLAKTIRRALRRGRRGR